MARFFAGIALHLHLPTILVGFILGFFSAGAVLLLIPCGNPEEGNTRRSDAGVEAPVYGRGDASGPDYAKGGSCLSIPKHANLADPWTYVKDTPPPAACLIRGMSVEQLDLENNFRRGWALGYTHDAEDKTHLLPYVRAARDVAMQTSKRRILLDLGVSDFSSSVEWFLRQYPLDFTEIHVFEGNIQNFMFPLELSKAEMQNILMPVNSSNMRMRSGVYGPLPNELVDRVHLHHAWVDVEDGTITDANKRTVPKVNITRFIKGTLKVQPGDAFILKMDIEGGEWKVLQAWMEEGGELSMRELVDEMFVEVHYHDETVMDFNWFPEKFPHTREEAAALMQELRVHGFYAHVWP